MIRQFCEDVNNWFTESLDTVAVIHCRDGRGRTGLMIACYLIFSGRCQTAPQALHKFDWRRAQDGKGVTLPSQRRYVHYWEKLILAQSILSPEEFYDLFGRIRNYKISSIVLKNHIFGKSHPKIHLLDIAGGQAYSITDEKEDNTKNNPGVIFYPIPDLELTGDTVLKFFEKENSNLIFSYAFHPAFLEMTSGADLSSYKVHKSDLDGPTRLFPVDFSMEITVRPVQKTSFNLPAKLGLNRISTPNVQGLEDNARSVLSDLQDDEDNDGYDEIVLHDNSNQSGPTKICSLCGKPISSSPREANNKHFHEQCLKCSICRKLIKDKDFAVVSDRLVCVLCIAAPEKEEHQDYAVIFTPTTIPGSDFIGVATQKVSSARLVKEAMKSNQKTTTIRYGVINGKEHTLSPPITSTLRSKELESMLESLKTQEIYPSHEPSNRVVPALRARTEDPVIHSKNGPLDTEQDHKGPLSPTSTNWSKTTPQKVIPVNRSTSNSPNPTPSTKPLTNIVWSSPSRNLPPPPVLSGSPSPTSPRPTSPRNIASLPNLQATVDITSPRREEKNAKIVTTPKNTEKSPLDSSDEGKIEKVEQRERGWSFTPRKPTLTKLSPNPLDDPLEHPSQNQKIIQQEGKAISRSTSNPVSHHVVPKLSRDHLPPLNTSLPTPMSPRDKSVTFDQTNPVGGTTTNDPSVPFQKYTHGNNRKSGLAIGHGHGVGLPVINPTAIKSPRSAELTREEGAHGEIKSPRFAEVAAIKSPRTTDPKLAHLPTPRHHLENTHNQDVNFDPNPPKTSQPVKNVSSHRISGLQNIRSPREAPHLESTPSARALVSYESLLSLMDELLEDN
uniref:Phosphatidylinositol-3,4,5-trisphosphate 3-phosphatase n=1 Tax=Arcella intermedia TaxID=1963864 RepID=A0A6B2KXV1_9EUKA